MFGKVSWMGRAACAAVVCVVMVSAASAAVVYQEDFTGKEGLWLVRDLGWTLNAGTPGMDVQVTTGTLLDGPAIDRATQVPSGQAAVYMKSFARDPGSQLLQLTADVYLHDHSHNNAFSLADSSHLALSTAWTYSPFTWAMRNGWGYHDWTFYTTDGTASSSFALTNYLGRVTLGIDVDEMTKMARGWIAKAGQPDIDTGWVAYDTDTRMDHVHYYNERRAGYGGMDVDNIVVSAVPEPATLCLLALGGLALIRRRH